MAVFEIRDASSADLEAIETHRRLSAEEASSYRGSLEPSTVGGDDMSTLVAEVQGEIVGSCSWCIENEVAVVLHVYVDPVARGVGVGDALLGAMLRNAATVASRVRARALPGDRELKNLYERHGMTAQTIIVGKVLDQ